MCIRDRYNYSMSMTSITSSTIISSSSSAFTLILSVFWLHERVTLLKLLGVTLCWLGNGLTAVSDTGGSPANTSTAALGGTGNGADGEGDDGSMTISGDAICLLSAILYALYTVLIRKLSPPDLSLFFGFLGLATFLLFGPVALVLHLSRLEDLSALTPAIGGLLLLKGLVDNCLLYTSPSPRDATLSRMPSSA